MTKLLDEIIYRYYYIYKSIISKTLNVFDMHE